MSFKKLKNLLKKLSFTSSIKYPFSVGITTFEHRFEKYFVPLVNKIREYDKTTEIIVAINGEHGQQFNNDYRKSILNFLASHQNIYPIVFPQFRGLSKLWNSLIIHSTNDHIVLLNDDIMIYKNLFDEIGKLIAKNNGRSFIINQSWSHFVVSRLEIDDLGYFDERLLGIGEEDGDMTWRYINAFHRPLQNYKIKGLNNFAEETVHSYKPTNITCHSGTKYSLFNRDFMTKKYTPDPVGLKGMFQEPVTLRDPGTKQYPNEQFFHSHKTEL